MSDNNELSRSLRHSGWFVSGSNARLALA
jgi:hypothetical protein